jgi:hypothetical protein
VGEADLYCWPNVHVENPNAMINIRTADFTITSQIQVTFMLEIGPPEGLAVPGSAMT